MTRLSEADARARLAEAWETVFREDPAPQQIVHVLAPPSGECPAWLAGFAPYEDWKRNGGAAREGTWRAFAAAAAAWPYIGNARRAAAAGIPNVRIYVMGRARREPGPDWERYLAEVHAPATSALAGEELYRVWRQDCLDAGIPGRDHDVNLWGAAGVMLTGYRDGDVDWREFLSDDGDLDRSLTERRFISAVRALAAVRGEMVMLPPLLHDPALPPRAAR